MIHDCLGSLAFMLNEPESGWQWNEFVCALVNLEPGVQIWYFIIKYGFFK